MTPRYFLLIVLLALCSPWTSPTSQAAGGMLLNRSIVVFKPGQPPRQDATILNQEDENLYINIEILEVRNPGTEQSASRAIIRSWRGVTRRSP